jgi:hypothetical protein
VGGGLLPPGLSSTSGCACAGWAPPCLGLLLCCEIIELQFRSDRRLRAAASGSCKLLCRGPGGTQQRVYFKKKNPDFTQTTAHTSEASRGGPSNTAARRTPPHTPSHASTTKKPTTLGDGGQQREGGGVPQTTPSPAFLHETAAATCTNGTTAARKTRRKTNEMEHANEARDPRHWRQPVPQPSSHKAGVHEQAGSPVSRSYMTTQQELVFCDAGGGTKVTRGHTGHTRAHRSHAGTQARPRKRGVRRDTATP